MLCLLHPVPSIPRGRENNKQNNKMKNNNKNNTPTLAPVFKLERGIEQLRGLVTYDGANNAMLKAGSKIEPQELAAIVADNQKQGEAFTIRAANTFRLSRMLPPVKGEDGNETPAVVVVQNALRAFSATDSAYYGVLALAEAIDVHTENKLSPAIAFQTVREAMGTLRKLGALPKAGSGDKPLLKAPKGEPRAQKLVKLLKDATPENAPKANGIRDYIADLMGKPRKGKKAASVNASEGDANKVQYTPETLKAAIIALRGQWELTVKASTVEKVRAACSDEVGSLAKLAGFTIGAFAPK